MNNINPLDIIDTELSKAEAKSESKSSKRQVFLYLKQGHIALIRPLYELNKCLALQKHDIYSADLQVAAICATEQNPNAECAYCFKAQTEDNKRLLANYRIYLPIFIYNVKDESGTEVVDETGNIIQGVRILELGAFGKIGDVLRFFRSYMKKSPITEADFTCYHKDVNGYKIFEMKEVRKKPMNPKIKEIIPSIETAKQHVLEAYAPKFFTNEEANKYFLADAEIEEDDELLPSNFTGL